MVSMKLVSLAYDLDSPLPSSKRRDSSPSSASSVITPIPSPISFVSFAIFPATTVFGPFVTYNEHLQYTRKAPIVNLSSLFILMSSLHFRRLVGFCVFLDHSLSVLSLSASQCVFFPSFLMTHTGTSRFIFVVVYIFLVPWPVGTSLLN